MMSVEEYALDVNYSVSQILKKCKELGINVSSEEDLLSEDDIDTYKKAELPKLLEMTWNEGEIEAGDITFSEVGKVSDEVVPLE